MGCGLKKMKPVSGEQSPGKIYSTLKRPQVETRVGPAYTYRYLDFLIGKDGGTSTLRLSSVREVPAYLQELYLQGFVLAALHPFIQPCVPGPESPEHQLYRAILVRHEGGDRGPSLGPQYRLQLEECVCADQEPSPELIQGYVKKHIQDAADQGVMFVGFIQEAQGAPSRREADLRSLSLSLSLSLHSSPSSVLGSLNSSPPHSPPERDRPAEGREDEEERSATCRSEEGTPRLNNNATDAKEGPRPQRQSHGPELLALYHLPPPREPLPREPLPPEPPPREPVPREPPMRFYTVKVPLRLQSSSDGGVSALDGPWLDHLTQHFSSGASLVHGHFSLLQNSDVGPKAVESVFIFQEPAEAEATVQAFDAIVVEQWTVIHGLQVKADYVPLLQSLASFGWRLTCVLPTPVVRSNSDGSLSTKQIVFLQRPVQSRKKKDSKVESNQYGADDTALNGVRLICAKDDTRNFLYTVESHTGFFGDWSPPQYCPSGVLTSFQLRVEPHQDLFGDDTAVNNIKFRCSSHPMLEGAGMEWGNYGHWSQDCGRGGICGLETKMEEYQWGLDDSTLNDVRFHCCDKSQQ